MYRSYRVARITYLTVPLPTAGRRMARTTEGEEVLDWTVEESSLLSLQHRELAKLSPGTWAILFVKHTPVAICEIVSRPNLTAPPPPGPHGQRLWVMEDHARKGPVLDLFPHVLPTVWCSDGKKWINEATGRAPKYTTTSWMVLE